MRIVVVGGVAGGASAAARLRRLSESAQITIFERGPYVSFANCGLPYFVGGEITSQESLLLHTPGSLHDRFNLDVRVQTEVAAIDRVAREVEVLNLITNERYREPYDVLILSTGATPVIPPIPGIQNPGHFTVRSVPDVRAIETWIKQNDARRAVVVGGGYIGLEMTEQLRGKGLEVTLVEAQPQVMAPLDPEMAAFLHEELRCHGVSVYLNTRVIAFDLPSTEVHAAASLVRLSNGTTIPADLVILSVGTRPESDLARKAGLEIGDRGGIRVDEHMQTSDPSIYAIGDAIEVRDGITGRWTLISLAGPANRQGRIAADNIVGRCSTYKCTWGTSILRVFEQVAACVGASEKTLRLEEIPYHSLYLHPGSHAGYYPGAFPIALKLLFNPVDGKILGAQAVGRDGVDKRIDVLATALQSGLTVRELAELELAYAPPFGSAKDPVNLAGMIATNIMDGLVSTSHWNDIDVLDEDQPFLLDVRSVEEHRRGAIRGSVLIPLPELRDRLGELPRNREIIVYCHSGQRSYYASRILEQNGFQVRNLSGAWRTWSMAQEISTAGSDRTVNDTPTESGMLLSTN